MDVGLTRALAGMKFGANFPEEHPSINHKERERRRANNHADIITCTKRGPPLSGKKVARRSKRERGKGGDQEEGDEVGDTVPESASSPTSRRRRRSDPTDTCCITRELVA